MGLDGLKAAYEDDDDLTNLTWLQDGNLLRNVTAAQPITKRQLSELNENLSPSLGKSNSNGLAGAGGAGGVAVGNGGVKACTVPPVAYNPQVHIHAKPPYSFSSLIFMAIESSDTKALPVKEIYSWVVEQFPYYQSAPNGWKNTVRHNLSLNKCFRKVDKSKDDLLPVCTRYTRELFSNAPATPAHSFPVSRRHRAVSRKPRC